MSSMILVYAALIAVVVIGLITASMLYQARRRGKETAGQPQIAPPLAKDQPPPPPPRG